MPRSLRLLILLIVPLFAACNNGTLLYTYQPVEDHTWGVRDTFVFDVPPMSSEADCRTHVNLRLGSRFPYRSLWVVLEQQWLSPTLYKRDTLELQLTDAAGVPFVHGGVYQQIEETADAVHLVEGQHGRLRLWHIMRKENVPEVWNIGVRLTVDE